MQKAVLNKTEYAPSAENGLLLQLKYKFGYTPIMVAVPYLALMAAVGEEQDPGCDTAVVRPCRRVVWWRKVRRRSGFA
jgi:hypothetical protein